jgi:hypothetical protein
MAIEELELMAAKLHGKEVTELPPSMRDRPFTAGSTKIT